MCPTAPSDRAGASAPEARLHRRAQLVHGGEEDVAIRRQAAAKREAVEAFAWADQQPMCKAEDGLKNVFVAGSVAARQLA